MNFQTILIILLVLGVMAGVLVWLARANAKDRAAMAAALGFGLEEKGPVEAGDDPTRAIGHRTQQRILTGTLDGLPAEVWQRTFRRVKHASSGKASPFTVLSVVLPAAATTPLLVESTTLGGVHSALLGGWNTGSTADEAFDKVFRVSSPDPAQIREILTPDVRRHMLGVRAAAGGAMPGNAAVALSTALLQGTFEVIGNRASYSVMGTPRPEVSAALQRAMPALTALAKAVQPSR